MALALNCCWARSDDLRPPGSREDRLGGVGRLLGGILSLSGVLHHGHVAISAVHGVGDGLDPTVREGNEVHSVGEVAVPVLLGAEVVAGVVVLDGILPVVDCGHVSVGVDIGGGRLVGSRLWLVDNLGGRPGEGGEDIRDDLMRV